MLLLFGRSKVLQAQQRRTLACTVHCQQPSLAEAAELLHAAKAEISTLTKQLEAAQHALLEPGGCLLDVVKVHANVDADMQGLSSKHIVEDRTYHRRGLVRDKWLSA